MKFPVISRVGKKIYCQHCNKTVSKSPFYEHQTLYGDTASVELELDLHCDSETDAVTPCWDDEDRQFFSEVDDSSDDNGDDEVVSEVASVDENESNAQLRQQIQVSFKCLSYFKVEPYSSYQSHMPFIDFFPFQWPSVKCFHDMPCLFRVSFKATFNRCWIRYNCSVIMTK